MKKILQLQAATMKEQERQTEMEASRLAYRNRVRQYAFLAGAGVFLVIASILYRNNRQKQKSNRVLASTLANLKATQAQLIQSEKMASLGELTAGIAHEIQNPLNFVNNFSEVNNELIEELKSENTIPIAIGMKSEEWAVILDDVYQNNEKIKYHGKRAEAIVKNMMQHAGSGSTGREATDINSLVEEYLRLAYHGTRAKDNSFHAKVETHFDDSLGKINVVPQEIGRVFLNLINNAFYAVNEKQKHASPASAVQVYEPTVSVSTGRENARPNDPVGRGKVKITVSDNGNGIPDKIRGKIFQPFFYYEAYRRRNRVGPVISL
jgi:signal transduction histidine kinase